MTTPTPRPTPTNSNIGLIEKIKNAPDSQKVVWGIVIVKILFAFYTLPHNATALGLDFAEHTFQENFFAMMGLLTNEVAFAFSAFGLYKGWSTNSQQKTAFIVVAVASLAIMAFNSILAIRIEATEGFGISLGAFMTFYKVYVAPAGMFVLMAGLLAIGALASQVQLKLKRSAHKTKELDQMLRAELLRKDAQLEIELIKIRAETAAADDKASEANQKLELKRVEREANAELETQRIEAMIETRMKIADLAKEETQSYLASEEMAGQIKAKAKGMAERFMRAFLKGN